MKNKHATDGIAEDVIRSFVQIACAELHTKTLLEKRISEIENGFIDIDTELKGQVQKIEELQKDIHELASVRRADMLYLFHLYGAKGDKEQWCHVKHLGIAMMSAFEAWQGSDEEEQLLHMYVKKNTLFIKAVSKFLGIEMTECASCFADILKGGI